jgi:hypothetical protein
MSVILFGCWGDYKNRVKEVLSSLYKDEDKQKNMFLVKHLV